MVVGGAQGGGGLLLGRFLTFFVGDDSEHVEHVEELGGLFQCHNFTDVVNSALLH